MKTFARLNLAMWMTGAVLASNVCFAQDSIVRRRLVERAQEASRAGRHDEALDLAIRAGQVQMTPSLQALIATEHFALNHFAETLDVADQCVRAAERDTALRSRDAILSTCRQLVEQAHSRVGNLTVRVPANTPNGLAVTVAGRALNPGFYGIPYVVNPGVVRVEAHAPGHFPFVQSVTVTQGATATLNIELVVDNTTPPPPVNNNNVQTPGNNTPANPTGSQSVSVGVVGPVTPPPRHTGPGAGPWVVVGIGGAALGASLALFLVRNAAFGQLEQGCVLVSNTLMCPNTPMVRDQLGTATTLNAISIASLAVGVAAVAGGLTWYFVANRRTDTPPATRISLVGSALDQGGWAGVTGSF